MECLRVVRGNTIRNTSKKRDVSNITYDIMSQQTLMSEITVSKSEAVIVLANV